jgi:peptidoglycan-associated lipoprotein
MLLLTSAAIFAQEDTSQDPANTAFWVNYWQQPQPVVFGPEQAAFSQSMQDIMFARNEDDNPSNPSAIDANVQWLKDHPGDRFYIHGYASTTGDLLYNLALSQRRADFVKQALISRGIPEDRIVSTVGWGELYPACAESDDECWAKNRLVRFVYSPN